MQAIWHWLWGLGPGNPVFLRVLHGGSRQRRHQLVRSAYLGLLIILLMIALSGGGGMGAMVTLTSLAKAGTQVFAIIAYGQLIMICLLAPLFTAGAIASEHSGKTFDIMLATPLTNLQIVLGSLLGRLFFVLALLLSGLPLFAVLLLFGGVAISAVWVAFAVAALSALVLGSVAVALSVLRIGGRKAVVLFVIGAAGYLAGSYAVDVLLLRPFLPLSGGTTWLTPLHPVLVLETWLNRANYQPPPPEELARYGSFLRMYLGQPLLTYALLCLLTSAGLVVWSAIWVRRVGQGEGQLFALLRRSLRLSQPGQERRRPPRPVWHNPVAWREANTRGRLTWSILSRWLFVVLGLLVGAGWLWLYHSGRLPVPPGVAPHIVFRNGLLVLLLFESAVIALTAIYLSASCVSREREDQTLDLLLTTPISPRYYLWGKLRGLVSYLALMAVVPVATLGMVSLYTVIGSMWQWPQAAVGYAVGTTSRVAPLLSVEAPVLGALMLAPFIGFCVVVGIGRSVNQKSVLASVTYSLLILLGVLGAPLAFCGYFAAAGIPILGSILCALSPVSSLLVIVNPWEIVPGYIDNDLPGRLSLLLGAALATVGYGAAAYALLQATVVSFDQTIRRLSASE